MRRICFEEDAKIPSSCSVYRCSPENQKKQIQSTEPRLKETNFTQDIKAEKFVRIKIAAYILKHWKKYKNFLLFCKI